MALNPLDIQQKTFRTALKGYAEDEVDDFLDEVVMTVREYEELLAEARDETEAVRAQLSDNRDTEASLSKALIAAQRAADQITEEAQRDAERLLSDARADASRLSVEHGREKNDLVDELDRLRSIVSDVRARLADISGDVSTRFDAVSTEMESVRSATDRWEPETPPPLSAIVELAADEDADDGIASDRQAAEESFEDAWPTEEPFDSGPGDDASNDDASNGGASNDGASKDGANSAGGNRVRGNGDVGPAVSESVDGDDDVDPLDLTDAVAEAENASDESEWETSSARRPWERFDD